MATKKTSAAEVINMAQTGEPTVRIRLPLTRTEKDDVFVGVNGKTYLIKRGVDVDVPESVAEVLEHQEEALSAAMDFESETNHLAELEGK